jgi:hypothetical protein
MGSYLFGPSSCPPDTGPDLLRTDGRQNYPASNSASYSRAAVRPEGASVIRRGTLGQSHEPEDRALTRWINVGRGAPSPFFVVPPSLLLFRSLLPSPRTSSFATTAKPTKTKANSQTLARHSRHGEATTTTPGRKMVAISPELPLSRYELVSVCRIQGFRVVCFLCRSQGIFRVRGSEVLLLLLLHHHHSHSIFFSVTPYDVVFNFNLGAEW